MLESIVREGRILERPQRYAVQPTSGLESDVASGSAAVTPRYEFHC